MESKDSLQVRKSKETVWGQFTNNPPGDFSDR